MPTTIDLPALQAFVKVVQTGSFTAAADALHTHKARLSRVVGRLERELGARLLERTTRSLSLTEVGHEFHARAQAILASVDDARQAVQQAMGQPQGTLRLTCGSEFGMLAVSGWINRYLQLHPGVKVEVEMSSRLVDLVHEGFDLAIRVGELPDSSLAARRLGTLRYGLYASPAYLRRAGTPRTPDELARHAQLVFAGTVRRNAWVLRQGADTQRVPLSPRLLASNSFAVRDASVQGLGVALLPRRVAGPLVAEGRLRALLKDWQPPEVPVHAVFASARYLAPKVRAFVDLAVELFADDDAAPATAA